MKHFFACMMILLTAASISAQRKQLSVQASSLNRQVDRATERIYEGRPILSLQFRGTRHFSSETLRRAMESKDGDLYYAEKLEVDKDRLRLLLLGGAGYLKPSFGETEIEDTPDGLRIVIPLQEGIRYRLGAITIEDSTVFSPEETIKLVGLKSGEIADGWSIGQKLNELTKLYNDRGHLQFFVVPHLDFKQALNDSDEGVVDITLELDEGEVFRINSIRFEGTTDAADEAIRRELLIHDGDLYDESLLRRTLRGLNSLGRYEEVKFEDAAFHVLDQNKLDITIRLKDKTMR